MTDRRAELEKKRLKLQQLRELKEIRQKEKQSGQAFISDLISSSGGAPSPIRPASTVTSSLVVGVENSPGNLSATSIRSDINEVDDILESVGISAGRASIRNATNASTTTNHINHHPHLQQQQQTQLTSPDSGTSSDAADSTSQSRRGHSAAAAAAAGQSLSLASFPQVSIAPKEHVTYEKQTQTTATQSTTSSNDRGGQLDYYVLTYDDLGGEEGEDSGSLFTVGYGGDPSATGGGSSGGKPSHHNHNHQSHHPSHHPHQHQHQQQRRPSLPHVEMVRPAQTQDDFAELAEKEREESKAPKRVEYKEEERRHLMQTEAFRKFLDRAVRITERALSCADSMDIFVDYTGQVESVDSEDKSGLRLALNATFVDERWSKGRAVTSFDWCSQFPELLVTSYNQNDEAPNEPDGICLVWNMKFKKTTPEYVFHCQSPVMSACFAKFNPNLILGGTYSGQIVLWDNRSGKRVPVQRSPLSASAHTHPVYCLKVVGTQNSHNLISISNDGKLCSWSMDMLSAPQETMELCQQKQSRLIAAMSTSFPQSDYNNFVLGSQDGAVFSACRHGAKAGILDVFDGHQGPVTAVDFHAAANSSQVDLSHLFLTASFDWTFKLWSMREQKPLYSFEDGNDYLYDIRWSPIHPALFATVDGLGRLDIWNLNMDTELPTVSTQVEGMSALNRIIWSPNGLQLVVGDDQGRIAVYDVGEQLAFPKNDEWSRFSHTLQEFTNNSIEI